MKNAILIIGIFSMMFVASVSATIINIPDDYPTIQEGIDASADGDTVLVQPGTYVENINFNGHNIVLGSLFLTTGDMSYISTTIIDGDSSGSVLTFENDEDSTTVITGFTLQNGYEIRGGGIYCLDSDPKISHNIIKNNTAIPDENWNGKGGGIYCFQSNPTIIYNTICKNFAYYDGGGICCPYSNPNIINNTIYGNSTEWGYGGGIFGDGASTLTVTNTILWNDSAGAMGDEIYAIDEVWPVVTYCDIQDSIWPGDGNISCDPQFCYPDIGNFYLDVSSCCVGAGESGVDIGALGIGCGGCDYVPGDINGDGNVMGNDVTYGVRYFKGLGDPPPDSCPYEDGWLYAAGDANGNCSFTGSDITFLVAYFKGYNPSILWCPETPPIGGPVVVSRNSDVTPVVLPKR